MSYHLVTLLLGSNLGNSKNNIDLALGAISEEVGCIIKKTRVLETIPVEFVSNNIFCNIAILIKTQFSPVKLLDSVKAIERRMGRTKDSRSTSHYTDRIIDIDIVQYGDLKFECLRLGIPHYRHLYERDFSRELLLDLENIKT